jgi:hypothetical protein
MFFLEPHSIAGLDLVAPDMEALTASMTNGRIDRCCDDLRL